MKKKILAGILVLALVIGLLPNNMHQVEAAYTETTLTIKNVAPQDAGNRYLIWLDASDVMETSLNVNALWPNNTVYIDGKAVSSSNSVSDVNYAIDSELLLLTLDYSVFGATVAAEVGKHTVIIPAGTIIGGTIKTTNDVGVIINNDSITEAEVITFAELEYAAQADRYLFRFQVDGTTVTDRFWNGNTVYLDGNPITTIATGNSVHYAPVGNNNEIYFLLYYSSVEAGKTTVSSLEKAYTLTIPGGTTIGDCILKNTLNYTLNKESITPEKPATADVTVTPAEPHGTGTYGFQFKVGNPTDKLAYDGQWTLNYYFANGGVSYQSSGVTETRELPQVFLKKIGVNTYYLAFDYYVSTEGLTYQKGDKVIIDGLVQSVGYGVQFAETTFEYDGSAWVLYEETEPTLTFTKTDGGAWQPNATDGDRWLTHLTSIEAVPAEGTFVQSGISIVVSDGETETSYTLNAGDLLVVGGKWTLLLWKNSYPVVPTQDETNGKAYIVTIKAGTATVSDGSAVMIPQDIRILYADGSARGVITGESKIVATNIGGIGGVEFGTETDNGWAYDGTAWSTRPYIEYGTITLDDAVLSPTLNSLVKYGANSYYFSLNPAETSNIPSTLKVGSIVTFDFYASETKGGGGGSLVYFPETSLQLTETGWETYVPSQGSSLTFTNTSGGAWQPSETSGDRWLTYFASAESVPTDGTYIQSGLSISVNDGNNKTTYPLNAGDLVVVEGKWAICLWKDHYPAVPNQDETNGKYYIVTIHAGTGLDNNGDCWTISEDVDILYCDGSVQGVIAKESTEMITVIGENLGGTGGIYFSTKTTNALSYSEGWDKRPCIECGMITLDSVLLTPTANSLVKLAETRYYFSLNPEETGNVPADVQTGSKIILDFYAAETQDCGKVFYFPRMVFELQETGWIACEVLGDVNGDLELDTRDIVRYKKYLSDKSTDIHTVSGDANESGKIDARDISTLIEYLFEGVLFTKGGKNTHAVTGIPYYADDIDISLGAYHGPRAANHMDYTYESLSNNGVGSGVLNTTSYLTSAEFKRYADAGLNTLIHEADGIYASATAKIGAGVNNQDFQTYMELAHKQGLDVYVTSQGLNSYLKPEGYGSTPVGADFNEDGNLYDNGVADTATVDETRWGWDYDGNGTLDTSATLSEIFYYTDEITDGNGKTILEADIEELLDFVVDKGYDNFKGFVMADEVYDGMSENYTKAVELIKAEGKERGLTLSVIGSQYPSSATGSKDSSGKYYIPKNGYESYIQKFGNAAGNFIFDRYPLLKNIAKDKTITYSLDTGWLTNLETVAEQGKAGGFSTGVTLQSYGGEWWSTTYQWYGKNLRRDPISDADIQFQVYTALAYGMKKINYFTYWEHPIQTKEYYTSCMVEYGENGGVETDVYRYVQTANKEIKKFDHVFLDYDWQETLSASDSKDTKGCVSTWSQTTDVILSRMYDKKKQLDGFWLVNASDPIKDTKKTVDVTFADATKAIVFADGEKKIVSLSNGKYETTLAAGEGQFVIPIQ